MLITYLIENVKNLGFYGKVLEHCFDDQIGCWIDILSADHAGDSSLDFGDLRFRKDSPFDRLAEKFSDNGLPAFNPFLLTVDHLHIKHLLGALLSNSRAHVSGANHRHTFDRSHGLATCHRFINLPFVPGASITSSSHRGYQ